VAVVFSPIMKKLLAFLLFTTVSTLALAERVLIRPSVSFTRPSDTTAYTAGDLVASSTSADVVNVNPMFFTTGTSGQTLYVRRAVASVTTSSTVNPNFRLHLFTSQPKVSGGDNAAIAMTPGINWFCAIDINMFTSNPFTGTNSGIGSPNNGSECAVIPPEGGIYGLLEARGAYQPNASIVFTITLEAYYP